MVQLMVTESPIKMGTPDWIPVILIPVLVYVNIIMYTTMNVHLYLCILVDCSRLHLPDKYL